MIPSTFAGSIIGVVFNHAFPDIILLILLTLLIIRGLLKCLTKALKRFRNENKQRKAKKITMERLNNSV